MINSAKYGKWEVVKSIGQGGQGRVYLVRYPAAVPNAENRQRTFHTSVATLAHITEELRLKMAAEQLEEEVR